MCARSTFRAVERRPQVKLVHDESPREGRIFSVLVLFQNDRVGQAAARRDGSRHGPVTCLGTSRTLRRTTRATPDVEGCSGTHWLPLGG